MTIFAPVSILRFCKCVAVAVSLLVCVACSTPHEDITPHAHSLCAQLFDERYGSLVRFDSIATEIEKVALDNNELQSIVDNAMGYVAMMDMDYSAAVDIYSSVIENSHCEIERLVADVGLMTICYRTSENRRFFDCRANALARMKRINEEIALLSQSDRMRYVRAKIEFAIVSVCYFSNLSMQDEKALALEFMSRDIEQTDNGALRLYAEMIMANNRPNVVERIQLLSRGVFESRRNGYQWLESNYSLLLAIMLRDKVNMQLFKDNLPGLYKAMNGEELDDCEFLLSLVAKAVTGFSSFGDRYMMIEALAVSASCNIEYGRYEVALSFIENALDSVNGYYGLHYPQHEELRTNSLFAYSEGVYSSDVAVDGVYDIPECLLSVRREASCAFAGVGDIEASNINRNAYLELLETTRLNKHMESRVSLVEESAERLDFLILLFSVLLVVTVFYAVILFLKIRRHKLLYSANLRQLQKVCRRLLASLPREVGSKEDLCTAISGVLNSSMGNLSGNTRFSVVVPLTAEESLANRYEFNLQYVGAENGDLLYVTTEHPLMREKYSIVAMLVPYVAVAIEEGLRLADICDERERAEEEREAYSIYLKEHKRENLLKRVSVSIVTAMRPFMDRISGELSALETSSSADTERKLEYIAELTRKLDDFNVILERWIKMRQGDMNLQVENFSLQTLFAIILKSKALMEKRGIALDVKPTTQVVKADKALTLFMVNTLVENAAKFTSAGGTVTLESIELDDCVEIAVTDTGIGLSQSDIDLILGEKVYDASTIGEDNGLLSPKKKGGGFGLMNCKGIIEKYRKSGELFKVCSMGIESVKGKGSRFSFRLPKGVIRLLLLVFMLPFSLCASGNTLEKVSSYADSVFLCNVEEDYEGALFYAGHAFGLLNEYYRNETGGKDTLSLTAGTANEIKWWREGLFPDSLIDGIYYNILDLRNETAVASLALQQWQPYRYNNHVYTTLYRMVHENKGISERYVEAKSALNYKSAAVAFLMFALLLVVLYIIVSYVRNNIIRRNNERMLLKVNERVLQAATGEGRVTAQELLDTVVREMYDCLGEGMRIRRVSIMLKDSVVDEPIVSEAGETSPYSRTDSILMFGVIDSKEKLVSSDGLTHVLPLFVKSAEERLLVGALEAVTMRPLIADEELNLELVADYTASVVYHAIVRVANSYMALNEIEELTQRVKYEENRLHVQNMVLDNCLSVLKHETVYYPSRIREIAEQAIKDCDGKGKAVTAMQELMEYYSSVFGILGNCAKRELDDRCFAVSKVALQPLFEDTVHYVARLNKRTRRGITLAFEPTKAVVSVDGDLIAFLLESLLTAAFNVEGDGTLLLRATDSGDEVKVELSDSRYTLSSDEVAELFVPGKRNIACDGTVARMEYLVAKEIVRMHEDNTGRRGSRLEARSDVAGTVIMFTLPK